MTIRWGWVLMIMPQVSIDCRGTWGGIHSLHSSCWVGGVFVEVLSIQIAWGDLLGHSNIVCRKFSPWVIPVQKVKCWVLVHKIFTFKPLTGGEDQWAWVLRFVDLLRHVHLYPISWFLMVTCKSFRMKPQQEFCNCTCDAAHQQRKIRTKIQKSVWESLKMILGGSTPIMTQT